MSKSIEQQKMAINSTISDLEQNLSKIEENRVQAILDKNLKGKESANKQHLDISFKILLQKDKILRLEERQRELKHKSVNDEQEAKLQKLQDAGDEIHKRFSSAFREIENLQNSLSSIGG